MDDSHFRRLRHSGLSRPAVEVLKEIFDEQDARIAELEEQLEAKTS